MEVLKAVVYARFSSDNQRDESIDAQLRAIEEYANKNDIKILPWNFRQYFFWKKL